jgi:hypothetical protein
VKYWICGGTMLGAARERRLISYDDDIDVAMHFCDLERLQSYIVDHSEYTIVPFMGKCSGIYRFNVRGIHGSEFDIFPMEICDGMLRNMYNSKTVWYNECFEIGIEGHLVEYSMGKFLDQNDELVELYATGPEKIEKYCEIHYGETWKHPRLTHVHNLTSFRNSYFYAVLQIPLFVLTIGFISYSLT